MKDVPIIPLPAFSELNSAFLQYIDSFRVDRDEIREHFEIKKAHTYRVIRNIESIAVGSWLSESETELARIIALFHDIGRFEQFNNYRTFDDNISENHAKIAIRVLQQQKFFSLFDDKTTEIITAAILNHNILALPEVHDADILLFSRLLRDADKLDIWKITVDLNVAATIRDDKEPDHYNIPKIILNCIREGRIVLLHFAESMNDFRLLRLSWMVDINFPASFSIIEEKGYIDKILGRMPEFPEKAEISEIMHTRCRKWI